MTIQLSMQSAVTLYREIGLSLIPLGEKSKEPAFNLLPGTWKIDATPEQLDKWFINGSKLNIGTRLGAPSSNLFEIDFDDPSVFDKFSYKGESFKDRTLTYETGRGFKILGFSSSALDFTKIDFRPELEMELRGNDCYTVLPPSIHPNGKQYTVLGIWQIEMMKDAKAKILKRVEEIGGKITRSKRKKIPAILNGVKEGGEGSVEGRNSAAFTYSRYLLFNLKFDYGLVEYELKRWNQQNKPPLPERELMAVLESATKYPPARRIKPDAEWE